MVGDVLTLTYQYGDDDDVTFHRYCKNTREAEQVQSRIGSVAGSLVERDGDFIYVMIDADMLDEAIAELEGDGFDVEEG
jgi:hypothetical protein